MYASLSLSLSILFIYLFWIYFGVRIRGGDPRSPLGAEIGDGKTNLRPRPAQLPPLMVNHDEIRRSAIPTKAPKNMPQLLISD